METKYDYIILDALVQKKWDDESTYQYNHILNRPIFSIDTPPPTVSGTLHIGHIFSYTHTDIIARFKRLSGYNVFYPFGFDDNGLPTERYVEKNNKISGHSMKRSDFIALCSESSQYAAAQFKILWKSIGLSADWSKTYSTISPKVQKISQASFIDLYKKNAIYRKEEPALYCTTCFTSVAQAELDDAELNSYFNDIKFNILHNNETIFIGTTRPELLASCVAIFFNPEDNRYQNLYGKYAIVPIFEHYVPILADELVDINKGTGLVMCCTFGDKTDIIWYAKHKLPYKPSIGFDGKWLSTTGFLSGLKCTNARTTIIEKLKELNYLIHQKAITHTVNIHERCKKEIELIIIKQWFLRILDHKQQLLNIAENITWYPHFMQSRYRDWVSNLQWDWCLSRQRFYGIPFPAWHCSQCSNTIIADFTLLPVDPQETKCPINICTQCQNTNFIPDTDVMDTWNTSSLTPYICAQLMHPDVDNIIEKAHAIHSIPMNMRPQAHDIIRTWAFYTLTKTLLHDSTIPWQNIVISGHVLSTEKNKISKSQNNASIDPKNLLTLYPADAIRYWTASVAIGQDITFSENQLKIGQKLITKLWNAFRFIKEHGIYNEAPQTTYNDINQWIINDAHETFISYNNYLEKNELSLAINVVEKFFWNNFCDNYIELIKDQLINFDKYTQESVAETRHTLYCVGLQILQLFSPYLPHITENLYILIYAKKNIQSIHTTLFHEIQAKNKSINTENITTILLYIITATRKLKTEKALSLKTPLHSLIISGLHNQFLKKLMQHDQILKGITHANNISYIIGDGKSSTIENTNNTWNIVISIDHFFIT